MKKIGCHIKVHTRCYILLHDTLGDFFVAPGTWKVVESPRREEWPDPSNVKEGQKANGGRGKWQCDVRKNTPCICDD